METILDHISICPFSSRVMAQTQPQAPQKAAGAGHVPAYVGARWRRRCYELWESMHDYSTSAATLSSAIAGFADGSAGSRVGDIGSGAAIGNLQVKRCVATVVDTAGELPTDTFFIGESSGEGEEHDGAADDERAS